ncbi:MAG: hypothetical protein K2O08_06245, partial [Clostridia bacterium]|nr:hypothetical protein [Clostridia bacterium]
MDIRKKKIKGIFVLTVLIILCLFGASVMSFFTPGLSANANETSGFTEVMNGDDLLLNDYKTRQDGMVFDGKVLADLYTKLCGEGKTYENVRIDSQLNKAGTTKGEIHSGLDSEDIRKKNDGNNVIVNLGGLQWIIVSLTTDSSKNTILTLLLADIAFYSQFNNWNNGNHGYDFPCSMYSSSYTRARLLNGRDSEGNEVKYVASAGAKDLTSLTDSDKVSDYPFNIFTLNPSTENGKIDRENGSITDFLTQPKDVPYQRTESMKDLDDSMSHNGWKQGQNDALDKIAEDKWVAGGVSSIQNKNGVQAYTDWGKDYIWLPSWAELGFGRSAGVNPTGGLWNTDEILRKSSGTVGTRTGDSSGTTAYNYCVSKDGLNLGLAINSGAVGARPAIHLNLSKADEHSAKSVKVPTNVVKSYNGSEQGIENEEWFTTADLGNNATIKYYEKGSSTAMLSKPKTVGE